MEKPPNTSSNHFILDEKKTTAGHVQVEIRGSKRHVKPYTIFSTELKAFSSWNSIQNTANNLAFSSFSFGLGLLVQAVFSGWCSLNPFAQAITLVGCPLFFVVAVASWRVGKYLAGCTKTLDEMIEDETHHDT